MINYSILYPPILPINQTPFEYYGGQKTFEIQFQPSVGNKIDEFTTGFIRIRTSSSEKNSLRSDFRELVIPFTNTEARAFKPRNDNIGEASGGLGYPYKEVYQSQPQASYNPNKNIFTVTLPQNIFGDLGSTITGVEKSLLNKPQKVQIILTKELLCASKSDTQFIPNNDFSGYGYLAKYNPEEKKWENITFDKYLSSSVLSQGLSSWSGSSNLIPLSPVNYKLINTSNEKGEDLMNISSPISEFVGVLTEGQEITNTGLKLKSYQFSITDEETNILLEESPVIVGQENKNLEIKWQNSVELRDKTYYIVKLKTTNNFDFSKDFIFRLKTAFKSSEFEGEISVSCDYDKARNEIDLNLKAPLLWGPSSHVELDKEERKDGFININKKPISDKSSDGDGIHIEEGFNLLPYQGSWSAEFIMSGIHPDKTWETQLNNYFFRMKGAEPTLNNPYQIQYSLYANVCPTSYDINYNKDDEHLSPYVEDIVYNPILQASTGHKHFRLFLESAESYTDEDMDGKEDERVHSLGAIETEEPVTHEVLYVNGYNGYNVDKDEWWELLIDGNGNISLQEASIGAGIDAHLKDVYLYDPIRNNICQIFAYTGEETPKLYISDEEYEFDPERGKQPAMINEFRLVKTVYALLSGKKEKISEQTYKAFMTNYNQKLYKWSRIRPDRKYYFHILEKAGRAQVSVADITGDGKMVLDRYSATGTGNVNLLDDTTLYMRGIDEHYMLINRLSYYTPYGTEAMTFEMTVDEAGVLNVDLDNLSTYTTTYEPLLEKDMGMDNDFDEDDKISFDDEEYKEKTFLDLDNSTSPFLIEGSFDTVFHKGKIGQLRYAEIFNSKTIGSYVMTAWDYNHTDPDTVKHQDTQIIRFDMNGNVLDSMLALDCKANTCSFKQITDNQIQVFITRRTDNEKATLTALYKPNTDINNISYGEEDNDYHVLKGVYRDTSISYNKNQDVYTLYENGNMISLGDLNKEMKEVVNKRNTVYLKESDTKNLIYHTLYKDLYVLVYSADNLFSWEDYYKNPLKIVMMDINTGAKVNTYKIDPLDLEPRWYSEGGTVNLGGCYIENIGNNPYLIISLNRNITIIDTYDKNEVRAIPLTTKYVKEEDK